MSDHASFVNRIKSIGIIGSSQVFVILVSLIKTKVFASVLGVSGIGSIGLIQSILDLIRSLTGFGIHNSGIRFLAKANSSDDRSQLQLTYAVFRKLTIFTGLLGALICFLFASPVSKLFFNSDRYVWHIYGLSLVIFFSAVTTNQTSLLQALKHFRYLAKANIVAALITLVLTSLIAFFLKEKGIILIFLITSIVLYISNHYYVKQIKIPEKQLAMKELVKEGKPILQLGFLTLLTGLATTGSSFLIRGYIANSQGLDSVGVFQAAWTISIVYIGIVLNAAGVDFYPRLSECVQNGKQFWHLVESQLQMFLYLVTPMLMLMLICSDFVIRVFYSASFVDAVPLLQWMLPGLFIKMITWVFSFVMLSRALGKYYILTELIWHVCFLSIAYFLFESYSIEGLGIAFLVAYLLYFIAEIIIMNKIGYRPDKHSLIVLICYSIAMMALFILVRHCSGVYLYIPAFILFAGVSIYSFYQMTKLTGLYSYFSKFRSKPTINE